MVHAGCVFVAGIHQSGACRSESFESVWRNACVRRQNLSLHSHPKVLWGMESETMLIPREKSPLPEAQRWFGPTTLHHTGQQAQHTTDWAISAPEEYVTTYLQWPVGHTTNMCFQRLTWPASAQQEQMCVWHHAHAEWSARSRLSWTHHCWVPPVCLWRKQWNNEMKKCWT